MEEVKFYENTVTEALKKALGENSTIEIYPALGNHDLFPLDEVDMSSPSTNQAI